MTDVQAFPLQWPDFTPRTPIAKREKSRFTPRSVAIAVQEVKAEVERAGGRYLTISTNIETKRNGDPYSDRRGNPEDQGVAVYFERKGRTLCFPCDGWKTVAENLHAIALHIEAIRGQERWKVAEAVDRAFEGYAMLPSTAEATWRATLNYPMSLGEAEHNYKMLAKQWHPDAGGDQSVMAQINDAMDQARKFFS